MKCPVCGAPVVAISSEEGTNALVYDPIDAYRQLIDHVRQLEAQVLDWSNEAAERGREINQLRERLASQAE